MVWLLTSVQKASRHHGKWCALKKRCLGTNLTNHWATYETGMNKICAHTLLVHIPPGSRHYSSVDSMIWRTNLKTWLLQGNWWIWKLHDRREHKCPARCFGWLSIAYCQSHDAGSWFVVCARKRYFRSPTRLVSQRDVSSCDGSTLVLLHLVQQLRVGTAGRQVIAEVKANASVTIGTCSPPHFDASHGASTRQTSSAFQVTLCDESERLNVQTCNMTVTGICPFRLAGHWHSATRVHAICPRKPQSPLQFPAPLKLLSTSSFDLCTHLTHPAQCSHRVLALQFLFSRRIIHVPHINYATLYNGRNPEWPPVWNKVLEIFWIDRFLGFEKSIRDNSCAIVHVRLSSSPVDSTHCHELLQTT